MPSHRLRLLMLILLLSAIAVAVGLLITPKMEESQPRVTVLVNPRPLHDVSLTDHLQRPFTSSQLSGKWSFVVFGYSHCESICPQTLATLDAVFRQLAKQDELVLKQYGVATQFLFVSLDPQRDTPERLAEFLSPINRHFLGLSGDARPLTESLGIRHWREGENEIVHPATLYLLDPLARWRASFSIPQAPQQIADEFLSIRDRYSAVCFTGEGTAFESMLFDFRAAPGREINNAEPR